MRRRLGGEEYQYAVPREQQPRSRHASACTDIFPKYTQGFLELESVLMYFEPPHPFGGDLR